MGDRRAFPQPAVEAGHVAGERVTEEECGHVVPVEAEDVVQLRRVGVQHDPAAVASPIEVVLLHELLQRRTAGLADVQEVHTSHVLASDHLLPRRSHGCDYGPPVRTSGLSSDTGPTLDRLRTNLRVARRCTPDDVGPDRQPPDTLAS